MGKIGNQLYPSVYIIFFEKLGIFFWEEKAFFFFGGGESRSAVSRVSSKRGDLGGGKGAWLCVGREFCELFFLFWENLRVIDGRAKKENKKILVG